MNEAERSLDGPAMMAPPSRNVPVTDAAPATGVMAPPPKAVRESNGKSRAAANGNKNGGASVNGKSTPDGTDGKTAAAPEKEPDTAEESPLAEDVSITRPQPVTSAQGASAPQPAARSASATSTATRPAATTGSPDSARSVTPPWAAAAGRSLAGKLSGQRPGGAKPRATAQRRSRRQAHLTVARIEPWSVMKFSFVASVVAFVVLFVAVAVLYMVLSALGVFDSLQHLVSTVTSSKSSAGTSIKSWFSASRVLGYTGLLGSLNIVLITAMATIGSVVYNLISRVFGGIEITLRESD